MQNLKYISIRICKKNSDMLKNVKFIIFIFSGILLTTINTFSQNSQTFNSTGGVQSWTVPACVSSLTVTVAGAEGGGNLGGNGAVITSTIPVQPGQVITMLVGGSGSSNGAAGFNGGGIGYVSNNGNTAYNSSGGGGATILNVNGTPYVIAGGGGGAGGGSNNVAGGGGGCVTGVAGSNTFGAGGTGGTQVSGGSGGTPWASTPPGGQVGSLGQGGNGGFWQTASGGGGGGGYYGGGGGGNDGCCTGANGGGGGGGGSSLVPAGAGCVQASNNGSGYVTIAYGNGITATNTGPYCAGATIQLNGTVGATYSWTGPNGFTSSVQNPTIPNSTFANAGVYSLAVSGIGCSSAATTTVVVLPPLVPSAGIDDTVCFGSPISLLGTLTVPTNSKLWTYLTNGISPTPTVQFSPSTNSLNPTVTVNQPGLYSFIFTESSTLCGLARDTVQIFVKQMNITTATTNTSCQGELDGTILLGGQAATQYSFDNGVTWGNDPLGTGFGAGTYTVCVRDANLCQACTTVTIVDPVAVVLSVSNDTLVCQNGSASLSASATGGTSFVYNWELFPTTASTQIGSPLVNTYYVVQAFNNIGCPSNVDSILVSVRNPITGTISPDITICPGYPTILTADAVGGIGSPFLFTWSSGQTGNGANNSITANPPYTLTYTVTVTDVCESTPLVMSTIVTLAPLPIPQISVDLDNKCEPAIFTLENETDPTMSDYLFWQISDGQMFVNQSVINTAEIWTGVYDVQLVVTSPFGCIDSTTFYNYLTVHPKPVADFRHSPNPATMFNTEVQLTNYSINGDSYQWFMESGVPSYSELKHLKTMFPDGQTGEYLVTLITTSQFGCIDTFTQIVIVLPEVIIYAPNAFTPDGDEHNQSWGINMEGVDVYDFELLIFNRWGETIWESHDITARWDGTYGGKIVQQGTYTWVIRAKDLINDGKYEFNGFINILK
jgi:gliding motility-associated-like protein